MQRNSNSVFAAKEEGKINFTNLYKNTTTFYKKKHKTNMALTKALKGTFFIGGTFFLIRLILAIIYGLNAQSVKIESYGSYIINVVMSIALAIGALSDLGLMIGSVMENKILLYIWIGAQFLVGNELLLGRVRV